MNNLLKVSFVAVGVAVLSGKVIANNDITQAIDKNKYPPIEQTPEELNVESYNKILKELDEARQWSGGEEPIVEISIFPRTQLSNLVALDLLMDIVKSLPEDSYMNFNYSRYDSMMFISVNKEAVDYIYNLNTVYMASTLAEELAQ